MYIGKRAPFDGFMQKVHVADSESLIGSTASRFERLPLWREPGGGGSLVGFLANLVGTEENQGDIYVVAIRSPELWDTAGKRE